jgi:hypothetical protein
LHSYYNIFTNAGISKIFYKFSTIDKSHFELVRQGMFDVVNVPGERQQCQNIGKDVCGRLVLLKIHTEVTINGSMCLAPKDINTIAIALIGKCRLRLNCCCSIASVVLISSTFFHDSIVKPRIVDTIALAD